ncbi:MAG: sensor histidine kinase [Candidatus Limnocylindria bacterium]
MTATVLRRVRRMVAVDTVIRRSLIYGGLTAGVVLTYGAGVVVLGAILQSEGPYAVTLLATGLAALVALPLRDQLQRSVTRMLYGDRDEPDRAISRLGERLEASLEPGTVLLTVAETVAQSLRLPYAAVELRGSGGTVVAAAYGAPGGDLVRVPLVHRGEEIGALALAPRAPNETFSGRDRALLAGLARQAGAAAYAVRLTGELQRSRQQLVSAREEERRRLRRELHDGMGPALAGSLMKLEAARALAAAGSVTELEALIAELADDTRRAIDDVRRTAYELRPPALDQLGLAGALDQEAERLASNGTTFDITIRDRLPSLPAAVEVAAYRIGLEALTNVARHARAGRASMSLGVDGDWLVVEVVDDGRGVPATARPGVGIASMRERAEELGGTVTLGPSDAGGTWLEARLPLAAGTADA